MITIDLTGKQAFVTGAARGLGKAAALTYARAGADVWVCDILEDELKATAAEIEALGVKSNWSILDVSDYNQYAATLDKMEKVDIIAHAAGIMVPKGLLSTTDEEIMRLIKVNILGVDNAYRAGIRKMKPFKSGTILTVASIAARGGDDLHSHYHMTKAAVANLNQSAALIAAKDGITCNTVCPGLIRTALFEQILKAQATDDTPEALDECWHRLVVSQIPMGRPQTEQEIADAILFLTSPLAKAITGQALNVCGGLKMN